MKKLFLLYLMALLTFIMSSISTYAFTGQVVIDGINYYVITKGKVATVIKKEPCYSGYLIIPESILVEGVQCTVTEIGEAAFAGCSSLASVILPSTITNIKDYAFYECSNLTNLIIPNSVTSIGSNAFDGCQSLNSITVPDGVTAIGNYTFKKCMGLTHISIPETITKIGKYAFEGCNGITSFTFPQSVSSIGEGAFKDCTGLHEIVIQSFSISIGSYAFSGCTELKNVYCLSNKLPDTNYHVFDGSNIEYSTLYVPYMANIMFKSNNPWNLFGSIVPIEGNANIIEFENPLIKEVWQFSSPMSDSAEGNFYALLDRLNECPDDQHPGNDFWHSSWHGVSPELGSHYFQVEMIDPENMPEEIVFVFTRRQASFDHTTEWSVRGTDVPDAPKDACTELAYIKTPFGSIGETLVSPPFKPGKFKYLRFYSEHQGGLDSAYFDRTYFHLARFQIYSSSTTQDFSHDQCAKPSIYYSNGKLSFKSDTEDVRFVSEIKDSDIGKYYTIDIDLAVTYTISVYATKDGYTNSDVATATLCWIDVDPRKEGITDDGGLVTGVKEQKAVPVLIQRDGNKLSVSGAPLGTPIAIYDLSGRLMGNAMAAEGMTKVHLQTIERTIIVKIGSKSVKVGLQ